ncbi:hypothetical protein ES703_99625 [subsurface metagenome]
MVGIGQDKFGTGFLELLRRDTFNRPGGANRHKNRGFDLSVRGC